MVLAVLADKAQQEKNCKIPPPPNANSIVEQSQRPNPYPAKQVGTMPTFHQVGAKTTQQPPSDVSGDVAPESSAGHTNTTMRSDHITAGTPTGPSAPNSSSSKGQADSPAPGALHYQGDTTEDEDGSIGDGRPPIKKRPRRTKKVPKRIRRVTASPLPEAPPDSSATTTASAGAGTKKRKMQTTKAKRTIGMLLSSSSSSSSDDESSKDEKKITAGDDSDVEMEMAIAESLRTHRQQQQQRSQSSRSRSGGGSGGGDSGWLKSFHTSIGGPGSVSDGDSSSSEDDDDDLDHRLAAISRRNWLSSASRDAKLDHMATISSDADKILQMLLWDVGFDYQIYSHQHEAIRFVAGLQPTFPLVRTRKNPKEKTDESDSDSSLDDDDEDESVRGMLRLDSAGGSARSNALRSAPLLPTRGMLLADEMGLGKTIESLAGAALRNVMQQGKATTTTTASSLAITPKKKSSRQLPVLIVVPQDGILGQWEETLRKAGVEPARIKILGERKKDAKKRSPNKRTIRGGIYILCTRYKVQSEMRRLFDCSSTADLQANQKKSDLFPSVSTALIKKLRNQYRAEKGTERNKFIRKKEARTDCVARLIRESFRGGNESSLKAAFHTVIVDEAHFVKNLLAYWGMGVALLGAQSKRTVLCTGTPYNNGPQDMSALMTFLDPRHEAARVKWWEDATDKGDKVKVVEAVSAWRKTFMIRRTKDILQNKLPPRIRETIDVGAFPCELGIYEAFEYKFLSALNQLQEELEDGSPESRRRAKELFDIMMACMSCMRMSLVHPMLPGGREATIQFSPSRRHLLKREERPKQCVFCCNKYPSEAAKIFAEIQARRNRAEEEGGGNQDTILGLGTRILGLDGHVRTDMDLDDDSLDDEDLLDEERYGTAGKKKGPLVQLSADICQASGSDCRHFGHEKCLQIFLEGDDDPENRAANTVVADAKKESAESKKEKLLECPRKCPRCCDLSSRLRIIDPSNPDGKPPHATYCEEVTTTFDKTAKGFIASAKIEEAVQWFRKTVPKNEKALILSFFKGSLDLMEGILVDDLGLECVRYDGDVDKEVRARDLERFKKSATCRVLLATVQSGGTGLNITEANNVLFLDRWFNPCVHDQAESRCHRIGQTKPVKIAYLDNVLTVDVVMKRVNALKEGNAGVLLADGTSLGDTQWSLGYQNLSGVIGNTLKAVMTLRTSIIETNGNAPLPTGDGSNLEAQLEEKMAAKASSKKTQRQIKTERKVKAETSEEKKEEDNEFDKKVQSNLKRSSSSRSIASSSSSSDSDDDLLGGSPIFGPKKSKPETAMRKYSLSAASASSSDDDDLLNGSPTFRKRSSENKDISNYASQAKSTSITESTSSSKTEKSVVKMEPAGIGGASASTKKRTEDDVVVELLSSDSEEEGANNSETRNLKPKSKDAMGQKLNLLGNGIGATGDQNAGTMAEEEDPEYQRALYESMNERTTKKIDGDDIDDANTDNAKAKIETSSSEELMQAMNDAMKSGDKTRAQALLKRWEASLS